MSREKQIDEMARIIGHCESTLHPDIECHNKATGCYCIENPCHNQRIAEKIYNAGFRKQSKGEWISVDERLPEIDGKYLAYTTRGTIELARCYSYVNGTPQFDYWITHWMPLPEAPKMKGGAESDNG